MPAGTGTLLVVEDNAAVARRISYLVRGSLQTMHTHTRDQALAIIERERSFAAAVIDIGLPDGSGLEVAERLRARFEKLPIAILTSSIDPSIVNHAQLLHCTYVCKPDFGDNLVGFLRFAIASDWTDNDQTARALAYLADRSTLSIRETQVLAMAGRGLTRKDIATQLGVSENTVKTQVSSLLSKTGLGTLSDVVWEVHNVAAGR